jgi:hypothetical protein
VGIAYVVSIREIYLLEPAIIKGCDNGWIQTLGKLCAASNIVRNSTETRF